MKENVNTKENLIKLDNVEVIYHPNNKDETEFEQRFIATSDGKTILIKKENISCMPDTEGNWNIKYKSDEPIETEHVAKISSEDKKKIDDASRLERESVILKSCIVKKLVTHTCISLGFYKPLKAQKILIKNSVFSAKAKFFCKKENNRSKKDGRNLLEQGDYFLIKKDRNIDFTFNKPNENDKEKKKEKEESNEWKIYYNQDKSGHISDGHISDGDSQKIVDAVNKACEDISKQKQTLKTAELGRDDEQANRFALVSFPGYRKNKEKDKKAIVYSVERFGSLDYYIETGLFCGLINFGEKIPPLEIRTEYSNTLVMRMIDRCCGIYVDTTQSEGNPFTDNIYSKIVQYMYLLSLRKVITILVPQKYRYLSDRAYNIRGNIDINAYVNRDLITKDKKVSFVYPERREIQSIIDVMYVALKCCKNIDSSQLPNLKGYEEYLESIYSGKYPSRNTIKNIEKEKSLRTGLYSSFRRPLEIAKMLLENSELSAGDVKEEQGVSALLMDSSYLWEIYLETVMRNGLKDWSIDAQATVNYYDNQTFYPKENRPDFVLTNNETGDVFILDAKFKHMEFRNRDVDNHDLQQLHSYSYYYLLTKGSKFRGAALIYPTIKDQYVEEKEKNKKFYAKMFGVDYADEMEDFNQQFGIITLKDANKCEENEDYDKSKDELSEMQKLDFNERAFISRLENFLRGAKMKI